MQTALADRAVRPSHQVSRRDERSSVQAGSERTDFHTRRAFTRDVEAWSIDVHRQSHMDVSRARSDSASSRASFELSKAANSEPARPEGSVSIAKETIAPSRAIPVPLHAQLRMLPPPQSPHPAFRVIQPSSLARRSERSLGPPSRHLSKLSSGSISRKRTRRLLTDEQTNVLYKLLEKTHFPPTQVREAVAKQLGISPRKVQVWFQNRRQVGKKMMMMQQAASVRRKPPFTISASTVAPTTVPSQPKAASSGSPPFAGSLAAMSVRQGLRPSGAVGSSSGTSHMGKPSVAVAATSSTAASARVGSQQSPPTSASSPTTEQRASTRPSLLYMKETDSALWTTSNCSSPRGLDIVRSPNRPAASMSPVHRATFAVRAVQRPSAIESTGGAPVAGGRPLPQLAHVQQRRSSTSLRPVSLFPSVPEGPKRLRSHTFAGPHQPPLSGAAESPLSRSVMAAPPRPGSDHSASPRSERFAPFPASRPRRSPSCLSIDSNRRPEPAQNASAMPERIVPAAENRAPSRLAGKPIGSEAMASSSLPSLRDALGRKFEGEAPPKLPPLSCAIEERLEGSDDGGSFCSKSLASTSFSQEARIPSSQSGSTVSSGHESSSSPYLRSSEGVRSAHKPLPASRPSLGNKIEDVDMPDETKRREQSLSSGTDRGSRAEVVRLPPLRLQQTSGGIEPHAALPAWDRSLHSTSTTATLPPFAQPQHPLRLNSDQLQARARPQAGGRARGLSEIKFVIDLTADDDDHDQGTKSNGAAQHDHAARPRAVAAPSTAGPRHHHPLMDIRAMT